MTTARRLGLLLGLFLALAALGRTLAAHRQVASPNVEFRAPIQEWMLTNFGARDVEENRFLVLTSLPAKHKVRFMRSAAVSHLLSLVPPSSRVLQQLAGTAGRAPGYV